ncbi:GNAT family N-acetyltransferase [Ornithinimicrobium tianjinense]|uniref:N-acetyltransferase domain-containing protein n=1 Tax=Ornithinimicrobium tianjinense TaxID=1195761 RepID=A0A917BW98_9MICO|nr:GNAT family N-acetyltransferase [Ornithinimicrobium tianjinense]GGF58804.1 hypothetical protein GCM10011366_28330 [Ornithinimicrobium tianjinense]
MTTTVTHRPAESRFVITEGDSDTVIGELTYETHGSTADLQHTEVDPDRRHHGLGARLAEEALRTFRADKMRVRPSCPFVAQYIQDHPEYANLLEPSLVAEDVEEETADSHR